MIIEKKGNLLEAEGYIVHGCNAQGVMGSGVAKQIKEKYPQVYKLYKDTEKRHGKLVLGTNSYSVQYEHKQIIVNAITQENYGRDPKMIYVSYDAIRSCFKYLNQWINESPYVRHLTGRDTIPRTVNFPLIGCGLANGDWDIVSEIIDTELDDEIEKVLWIYE